jgi:hypothetical protein
MRTSSRTPICAATRALLTATLALTAIACQSVPPGFGTTATQARTNADSLFTSLTQRFTNVSRSPRYAKARERIGRYALTPSEIYNDTSIWTSYDTNNTHTLFGDASFTNGRYLFTNAPSADPLHNLADGRHIMRLRKITDDQYEWFTGVDFAIGPISATDVGNVISLWLASAEGHSAQQLRADYIKNFPNTTTALGRLFTIDTLISVRDATGANTVYMGIQITPDGIRSTLPHYADYIDKYVKRLRFRFSLVDATGAKWFDAAGKNGYVTLRLRSKNGRFVPISGPLRSIPDSLSLHLDATVKISLFTVGVKNLTGSWVNMHTPHERGWSIRFTKEPEWELPPIVGHLIRSSLKRPFEGDGTQFRISVRDTPNQQTLLTRRGLLAVQESAILRFLGKLGGAAMGDFVANAEDEENRFDASVFAALRSDINGVLQQ